MNFNEPIIQVEFLAIDETSMDTETMTPRRGYVDLLLVAAVIDEDSSKERVCFVTTGGDVLVKGDYEKLLYQWLGAKNDYYNKFYAIN